MPYIELSDGVPMYYEDHGSGAPVVLIHGWTMNNTFWQGNIERLAERHRVITLDLRGHGQSGKTPAGHNLAQYARDVRELVEHLQLHDTALLGWSMGTDVILWYVRQYGCDGLRSVVFVDMSPRFMDGPDWEFALQGGYTPADAGAFAQMILHARPMVIKPFIEACFAEPPAADVVDAVYAETTKTPTDAAIGIWMDMAHADLRPLLAEVTVPALLVYGERSKIFPGDLAGRLAAELPDAEVARFANSGHVPFAEETELFNETVGQFLAKH
jgi:pimeloyl-ACP methyl ester carboxylesterase